MDITAVKSFAMDFFSQPRIPSPVGILQGLAVIILVGSTTVLGYIIYNIFFHPLRHIPGPFWSKATGLPSWYHTIRGRRHLWHQKQFEIYGHRVRSEPNAVIFKDPDAFATIYNTKANVMRQELYRGWQRNRLDHSTLTTIEVEEHATRRRLLNNGFTDRTVRAFSPFIVKHVERLCELLALEVEKDKVDEDGWSATMNAAEKMHQLIFDIVGELALGGSFGIKEPGENQLKVLPQMIAANMRFIYSLSRSPFQALLVSLLQSRFVEFLRELVLPPAGQAYVDFLENSVFSRLALQEKQDSLPEKERRLDMFYFLADAKDPVTGEPVYKVQELLAESGMLVIAGSTSVATVLAGVCFYLTGDPARLQKVTDEVRSAFKSVDEINWHSNSLKLIGCEYLRACIDETMRCAPPGAGEAPRKVLKGGIVVRGDYYPEGIVVGVSQYALARNKAVFTNPEMDPYKFIPERWIPSEKTGVTKEDVAKARSTLHPFLGGQFNCPGKNLAWAMMTTTLARILYRFDLRRAPGSNLGGGNKDDEWPDGRDPEAYQIIDAFIGLTQGPEVQIRKRKD